MYFLSYEEHKYVTRKLLPEARRNEVHPDLRGWNWMQPPLAPIYDHIRIGISDIASLYCPTSRDLYLKKVMKIGFKANKEMVEGLILHRIISHAFTLAKRILFNIKEISGAVFSREFGDLDLDDFILDDEREKLIPEIEKRARLIWEFEKTRIAYRIDDIKSRYPYCEKDAFVFLVLPVIVEQRLNGIFLGLSPNLAVDGYIFSEGMVVDVKFDPIEKDFHKLAFTGYAMVMESLYEFPVDLGSMVYVRFQNEEIRIKREFHHISDELRQWFIEERDRKMHMLENETDPGKQECYDICPYKEFCP